MIERTNVSQAVASSIITQIVNGELAPGDRIDLDALSKSLGVSRSPVREALIQLERDGLIDMPFHRGAFVSKNGMAEVREGFVLYALLSAFPARAVLAKRDPEVWAELAAAADEAEKAQNAADFEHAAQHFRRTISHAAGGPHLRSLLRTFNGLVRAVSRIAMEHDLEFERELFRAEFAAYRDETPDVALAATVRRALGTGDHAITVLRERGVLADDGTEPLSARIDELVATSKLVPAEGGER